MTTQAETLRAIADLLDGFPGVPAPLVIVQPAGSVTIAFHDGDARARVAAVDALAAVLGGEIWHSPRTYRGHVRDFHGRVLHLEAHDVAEVSA